MNKKWIKIILSIIIFLGYYYFYDIVTDLLSFFNVDITEFPKIWIRIYIYAMEIIPVIILLLIYKKDLKIEFENFKKNTLTNIEKYISLWCLALVLMSVTSIIASLITGSDTSTNEQAIRDLSTIVPFYIAFSSCILAPIGEELAFRKCVRNICNNNKTLSIILSGLLFGLAHVLGTYETLIDFIYIIPYGLFGAVFMYMYIESDSIFTTMSTHCIHNTLLTILLFIRG